MTLGLTDGTNNLSPVHYNVTGHSGSPFIGSAYGGNVGTNVSTWGPSANNKSVGVTTDASKSGIVGTVTSSIMSARFVIKY